MYQYLNNIEEARSIAKKCGTPLKEVVKNHIGILKNVLFKPRGNFYLTSENGAVEADRRL